MVVTAALKESATAVVILPGMYYESFQFAPLAIEGEPT